MINLPYFFINFTKFRTAQVQRLTGAANSHLKRFTADGAPDDDALVLVVAPHAGEAVVSNGEDVRGHLADLFVAVRFNLLLRVDGQYLVRVDGHQDRASVCLQKDTESCRS